MKKLLAMMFALILCLSLPMTAFAAETGTDGETSETDYDVCLYVDDTSAEPVVELQAVNAVTDGVVTITYDTSIVSVAESDVTVNKNTVDMYSVNAEEAGTLKISWLSGKGVTGTLFTLGVVLTDGAEIADAAFSLSGDVRDADGNLMILKNDASVEEVDKEALQALYDSSLTLKEEDYTEESWAVFAEAQANALAILDNVEATQEEVDAALEDLTAALGGLVLAEKTVEVDQSALQALYNSSLQLTESDYTEESWAALLAAQEAALAVLEDEDATQEETDAAWQTLLDAIAALDPSVEQTGVNLDALLLLYESSLKLTEDDYTEESWAALVTAQEAALAVLNNADATQEEADLAFAALHEAMGALERKSSDQTAEAEVNKDALQAAYDASLKLTESKYTAESWKTLTEARTAALKVLEDPDATQEEADEALAALTAATKGLKLIAAQTKTGDNSMTVLWAVLIVVAAAAVVFAVCRKRFSKGGER